MTSEHRTPRQRDKGGKTPVSPIKRNFWRDEDGALSFLGIFMFLAMATFGGLGVDLMMAEVKRTKMQSVLDSAVLAAASIENPTSPQDVVQDYFDKAGMGEYLVDVTPTYGKNWKRVEATAYRTAPSNFLRLLGITNLSVAATGAAEERVAEVEISLVLDISGSMRNNNKMQNVRDAATTFVETVLNDYTTDLVSINLIPYSEHVNIGPLLYNELTTTTLHAHSHCVEIPDAEMASTALDFSLTYEQAQHFQWNFWDDPAMDDLAQPICPDQDYERILPLSQSETALDGNINQLVGRAGTSIFLGMKWGAAMLDPSMRPTVTKLIDAGHIDEAFRGRPYDYGQSEVIKTIVIMTDGQNDFSNRLDPAYYLDPTLYGTDNDDNDDGVDDSTEGADYWAANNFGREYFNLVPVADQPLAVTQKYSAGTGNLLQLNMCNAAKAQGIIIWTIAFETPSAAANRMRQCASSSAHYFPVSGTQIVDTFESIAKAINNLKLVQ